MSDSCSSEHETKQRVRIKATLRQFFEALRNRNREAFVKTLAADATYARRAFAEPPAESQDWRAA
jgi:hypothetical protein